MDVGRGEKFAATCLDPAFAGARLTLRAMAIATAVIRDGGTMSATGALIDVEPSAAVRQRAIATRTLIWVQRIHWRLRSMKAVPAVRIRSATSRGGRLIYPSGCDLPFSTSESSGLAVACK